MNRTIAWNPVEVPLSGGWDVVVAGGGPAGCAAAAAAARAGARVLVIEKTGALGGRGTMGLVPAWCPFSDGIRLVYQGLAEKVLRATMAGMPHLNPEQVNWTPIDPERLKRVYDDLVLEAGAKVRFDTVICGVAKDGDGNVTAVYAASKRGVEAFEAKVFIDCTGDADLAVWAGAPFEKGGPGGALQAATHCFMLANVNLYGYTVGGRKGRGQEVRFLSLRPGREPRRAVSLPAAEGAAQRPRGGAVDFDGSPRPGFHARHARVPGDGGGGGRRRGDGRRRLGRCPWRCQRGHPAQQPARPWRLSAVMPDRSSKFNPKD